MTVAPPFDFGMVKVPDVPTVSSKDDALVAARRRDDAERGKLVARVEQAIAAQFEPGGAVTVPLGGVPSHVRLAVAEEYRAKGWTVEVTDDQRDGAYLTLK